MNREKVRNRIYEVINQNFTITNHSFTDDDFIQQSVQADGKSIEEIGEKLQTLLNKVFPDRKNPITISYCDTIDDIILNNFNFK